MAIAGNPWFPSQAEPCVLALSAYAYQRGVSLLLAYGQTLDSQLDQLRKAGCTSRNIYREKVTGAHSDRRQLLRMLGKLAPGDVVTVTSPFHCRGSA